MDRKLGGLIVVGAFFFSASCQRDQDASSATAAAGSAEAVGQPEITQVRNAHTDELVASQLLVARDKSRDKSARRGAIKYVQGMTQDAALRAEMDELMAALESSGDWQYERYSAPMGKGEIRTASIASENTLEFDFPYAGEQHGMLNIRTDPRQGLDIMVAIERGQIQCNSYSSCTIAIQFDDGDPFKVEGNPPSDHSTETVFLPGTKRLLGKIGKAKVMIVGFTAYRQGTQVLKFNVSGLDQSQLK